MNWMLRVGADAREKAAEDVADRDPSMKGGYRRSGSDQVIHTCPTCGGTWEASYTPFFKVGTLCPTCDEKEEKKQLAATTCKVCGGEGHPTKEAFNVKIGGKKGTVYLCSLVYEKHPWALLDAGTLPASSLFVEASR
jgi:hypothetical protein